MDYRIFNMHTDVNACNCTWGCSDTVKPVINICTVFANIVHKQCSRILFVNTFVLNTKTTLGKLIKLALT